MTSVARNGVVVLCALAALASPPNGVHAESAGAQVPSRTYRAQSPRRGTLTALALLSDGRFHAEAQKCKRRRCRTVRWDGTYRTVGAWLRFRARSRPRLAPHQWALVQETGALRLRRTRRARWFELQESGHAWCATVKDCGLQGISHIACAGGFTCEKNACIYTCRATPVEGLFK